MKKILGFMSLVAILMVSFVSHSAVTVNTDDNVKIVTGVEYSNIVLDVINIDNSIEFENHLIELGNVIATDNTSLFTNSNFVNYVDLPIDYGICLTTNNTIFNNRLLIKNANDNGGVLSVPIVISDKTNIITANELLTTLKQNVYCYNSPELIKDIITNVGK